jgi:galactitol-specific phosphotransferase system IIB component
MRDEVEMMAGSAGPALRKSAGRLTRYSTGGAESVGVNSLIGRSRGDGEHSSTLVEEAIKQAWRDRELLLQVHSEPECRNVRHVETMRQVHAALIREGSNNALLRIQNDNKQMKQSLAEAKSKLRDAIVVQEHLQKKIENHEKERVDLRAAIAFMHHQVASVEQSVHQILGLLRELARCWGFL